jgi:chromosome segregation ATPase
MGGMMNEKKIITGFFVFVFVFVFFSFYFSGCKTVGKYTDNDILEYQRRINELENTNRTLAERLRQYDQLVERTVSRLETVRERANGIRDATNRIEYLFGEYERTIQQFINELRENDGTVGSRKEDHKDIINYIALLDGSESFADYCRLYLADYQ